MCSDNQLEKQQAQEKSNNSLSLKEEAQKQRDKARQLEAIISVAKRWLYEKPQAGEALEKLALRVPKEHHNLFNFGYFPTEWSDVLDFMDDLHRIMPKFDPKVALEQNGIIEFRKRKPKNFYYYNPLLIPFYDLYGNPISIVGRTLLEEDEMKARKVSKYKNLPFAKSKHIFGLNLSWRSIVQKDYVVVVEGQFDFVSSFISGLSNCGAACGGKLCLEQIILLKRFTRNFFVLFDNDDAGDKGWKALQSKAPKYEIVPKRLVLPKEFHDVDQLVRAGGGIECLQKQCL